MVDFGLVVCLFFCQYWDPPGLLFPLRAEYIQSALKLFLLLKIALEKKFNYLEYILFLLRLYFFCNLDQQVLAISYSPCSK